MQSLRSMYQELYHTLESVIACEGLLDAAERKEVLSRQQEMIGVLDALVEYDWCRHLHDSLLASVLRKLHARRKTLGRLQRKAEKVLKEAARFPHSVPPIRAPINSEKEGTAPPLIARRGAMFSFDWYEVQVQVLFNRPVYVDADQAYTDRALLVLSAQHDGQAAFRWIWFSRPSERPRGLHDPDPAAAAGLTAPKALRREMFAKLLKNARDAYAHAGATVRRNDRAP